MTLERREAAFRRLTQTELETWEAIPTTNESYGYNKLDTVHKPVAYFIQLLAKTSAKGVISNERR